MTVVHRLFCENCGFETHNQVRFCPKCGHAPLKDRRAASCPKCGRSLRDIDNFCSGCGFDLRDFKQVKPLYCKGCGFMLGIDAKFCCQCGRPVEGASSIDRSANDDPANTLYGLPRIDDNRNVILYGSPPNLGAAPVYGTPRSFWKKRKYRK